MVAAKLKEETETNLVTRAHNIVVHGSPNLDCPLEKPRVRGMMEKAYVGD
jgi:hypothetical protein